MDLNYNGTCGVSSEQRISETDMSSHRRKTHQSIYITGSHLDEWGRI